MRRYLDHATLALALLVSAAACSNLDTIPVGTCGNHAIDDLNHEDCDEFSPPGTLCAPAGSADQCHYLCDKRSGDKKCPSGFGCGGDGLCRRPSGKFELAPRSPIPPTFGNLSLADIDGDKIPDLIAGDFDGLKVRFGTREGDYSRVIGVSLTLSTQAQPVLGNFDGAGGNDLVFVDDNQAVLIAATGTADQFLRPAPFPARDLTVQDGGSTGLVTYVPMVLGADKLQQLLRIELSTGGSTLQFLDGGAALAQPAHDASFVDVQVPLRIPVGNIDADAADEMILAIDGENKIRIFGAALDGGGLPIVQASVDLTLPAGGKLFNTGTDLADVNGDGKLDVVAAFRRADNTFGVVNFIGNGAGAFAAPVADARFDTIGAFFSDAPFSFTRPFLLAGDINGDKRADFLVGNADNTTLTYNYYRGIIYLNTASALVDEDRFFFLDAVGGDVNHDGAADFVLSTESGLDVRKGSPLGLLSQHFVPTGQFPAGLRIGDYDGDRLDDVAFVEGMRGPLGALPLEADLLRVAYGSPALPPSEPVSVSQWSEIRSIAPAVLGGLSQDATRDLAVSYADGDGNLWLAELRGRGDRTFLAPLDVGFQDAVLVPGHFAGAHADLMLLDAYDVASGNALHPMLMRGGVSGFVLDNDIQTSASEVSVVPSCVAQRRLGTAIDIDGDGVDEALVLFQCKDTDPLMVSIVRANVEGDFFGGVTTIMATDKPYRPFRVHVGDLDGDGKKDVVVDYLAATDGIMVLWNATLTDGSLPAQDVPLGTFNDVALINADPDPGQELAILVSGRVLIADVDVDKHQLLPAHPVIDLGRPANPLLIGDINRDGLDDLIAFPEVYFSVPFDPAVDSVTPPPPPGGDDCANGCNLAQQSCCGSGEACDLLSGETICRAGIGTGTETSECTVNEDCAAGYSCIQVLFLGRSECVKWCDADDDCVGPGGVCDLTISFDGTVIPGAVTCTPNCDPIASSGCPAGWGCHVYQRADGLGNETICAPAGGGIQGSSCADENECAPGFTCVVSLAQCLANCPVGAAETCPGGLTCASFDNRPTIGGVEWGVCLLQ